MNFELYILLIGAPLAGRKVLIVDDVITAGTAIREALALITEGGGTPAGIVIALDRQERVREDAALSAAQAVAADHGIAVVAVAGGAGDTIGRVRLNASF